MSEKTPINARLSAEIVKRARADAKANGMTLTDYLENMLYSYQTETGAGAADKKIKKLEAVIQEQEKIIKRHTGKGTPTKRRVTISLPVEDIQALETAARRAGMSRPEFIRACLSAPQARRILEAKPASPALPI